MRVLRSHTASIATCRARSSGETRWSASRSAVWKLPGPCASGAAIAAAALSTARAETVARSASLSMALSEQQRCVRGQHRSPNLKLRLGHKSMPLGQCGRASVLVNVTGDEMALLIEMVVDLGVN